ncbi:MAG: hypothetical protein LBR70_05735 [Lactobacillaceae bacterium]|jgi:hypothetical protein|nr:hypothetical protein [Lactobacillaceae bacterium]
MRKAILFVLAIVIVVFLANLPLLLEKEETFVPVAVVAQQKEDKNVIGEPITSKEINAFLKVWSSYMKSWASKIGSKQLSLTTSSRPDKKVPYLTKAWINRKGWEVGRFFYVEERLKAIVTSLEVENRANKTIELLEKQQKVAGDSIIQEGIKKQIDYQKNLLNIEKVSKDERDMVRPYFKELAEILKQDGVN